MANVNHPRKGIGAKLAFFGPPGSGKTTNLEFLNQHTANPAELMSVPHDQGRTVSFFLPLEPPRVRGVELRIRVVTLQTQLEADKVWRQVLRECDGVVFVADSSPDAVEANKRYVQLLADDLRSEGISPTGIPILLQLNRQDLPGAMTAEEAGAAFNTGHWPVVTAAATQGYGVNESASQAVKLICGHLQRQYLELGGLGELADLVHVHFGAQKEPVDLKRSSSESHAPPPPPADEADAEPAPAPSTEAAEATEVEVVEEVVEPDVAAAPSVVVELPAEAEPPAAAPPPLPPSSDESPAPVDAQPALAALEFVRQCAADAQARLGADAARAGQLAEAAQQVELLKESVARLSAELATLAVGPGEQEATLPAALDEVPGRLAEVEELLGRYREKTEALEGALQAAETGAAAQKASLEGQLEAAKGVTAQLARLNQTLEAEAASLKQEHESDLAALGAASQASLAEAEEKFVAEISRAAEQAKELEALRAQLLAAQAAVEAGAEQTSGELTRLQGELAEEQAKVQLAEEAKAEALQQLSLAVAAGEALQAQAGALTEELQAQKGETAAAQEKAKHEIVALMAEADQLRAQYTDAAAAAESLAARAQEAEGGAAEVAQLKQQVADLEASREEVALAMGNYQQVAARLQLEIKEKDAKLAELGAAPPKTPGAAADPTLAPAAAKASAKPSKPSGATTARATGAHAAAASPGADAFASDPNHQSARRLSKALITEFASRFLPGITEAVAKGNFDQAFESQVRAMRKAFDARVTPEVRQARDYLQEELDGLISEIKKPR